ncbi:FAD-binding oxidoreductase [Ruegeria sp. HKCCD8929]|uniref:NAD(P)/FAD-dependent oxidoreductase n=1 Tax=Ruegeria sp. HKCCD8929 TaxID=2683006 RepID=UPI0020C4C554|nr:FAD-binding oxidoreductase [Ruegeria sp. HKCCD8929]
MVSAALDNVRHMAFWQDQLGPDTVAPPQLPERTDVLVVGSGYTGLSAAIQTARGGRSTLVLDAEDLGFGCSTRNGGQISTSVKPSLSKLTKMFGAQTARAIRAEGASALEWLADFMESEALDCDFKRSGRYHAAHTPQHYEMLVRDAEKMRRDEGIDCFAVPRDEQRSELGSDIYFGGVVFPKHSAVDPAKMHREFLRKAREAGAQAIGNCAVLDIEKRPDGFVVTTAQGKVRAKDVIVATNGYSTNLVPWLRRRIIPIGSYIIVTEELPQDTIDTLFPTDRIASDTCKVLYYYRATPDRKRVLFGGRVSAVETDTTASAPLLYEKMCKTFPELRGCKVSHSWSGTVAYSFDELAHTGVHDGIHYAQGYCGSGVSMASYLGMRVGQKVLGLAEGQTAFDSLQYPTRPFYAGKPWFLPAAVAYYRWVDTWQSRSALARV